MASEHTDSFTEEETLAQGVDTDIAKVAAEAPAGEAARATYREQTSTEDDAAAKLLADQAAAGGAEANGAPSPEEAIRLAQEAAAAAKGGAPKPGEEESAGLTDEEKAEAARLEAEQEAERKAAEEEQSAIASGKIPKRVHLPKHLDEAERRQIADAAQLARIKQISFTDAMAELAAPSAEEAARAKAAEEAAKGPDELQVKRDRLKEVSGKLDELAEGRELDSKEKRDLQKEEYRLEREIEDEVARRAEQEAARVETEGSQFDVQWKASEGEAKKQFPEHFNNDKSPLNTAVVEELNSIKKGDRRWGDTSLPETLFAKHAARMGIAPAKPTAAPAKPPVKGTSYLPAPGGAKTAPIVDNAATRALAQKQKLEATAATDDPEAMAALIDEELTGKKPGREPVMRLG